MSEAIQPKDDKEYALRQCVGRLFRHTWQMDAALQMIRGVSETEMEALTETVVVLCNGLLAATSLMMTDLDELVSLLNVPLPDWDEIRKNQPGGSDLAEAIG